MSALHLNLNSTRSDYSVSQKAQCVRLNRQDERCFPVFHNSCDRFPGFSADLAVFDVKDVRELPYWYGDNRCVATFARGKACYTRDLGLT